MPNKNISNYGKRFSKDNQPPPEAKSQGRKKIKTMKEGLLFMGELTKKKMVIDGEEVELSHAASIAYELLKQASNGNLKAIELFARIQGEFAPTKLDHTSNGKEITNKVIIYDNGRGDLEDED